MQRQETNNPEATPSEDRTDLEKPSEALS